MAEKKQLYIPVKIKRRQEFLNIDGIGKKEAFKIIVFSIIGLILGGTIAIVNRNPIYLFVIFTLMAGGAYIFLKKDITNSNTIDKLLLQYEFMKSQKRFFYKYHNIYEKRR